MTATLRVPDEGAPTPAAAARLRPAPPLDPPYDTGSPPPAYGDARALRLVPRQSHVQELPLEESRGLRITRMPDRDGDEFEFSLTPRAALPDPGQHAARLMQAILEVLARRRPLTQLMGWTSEDVYEQFTWWLQPGVGHPPLRDAPPGALRSIRVSEPADGVAEVTAIVAQKDRMRAAVLRLEGIDGRWQCTLLRVL
jgi:hypothetical protein